MGLEHLLKKYTLTAILGGVSLACFAYAGRDGFSADDAGILASSFLFAVQTGFSFLHERTVYRRVSSFIERKGFEPDMMKDREFRELAGIYAEETGRYGEYLDVVRDFPAA
jgi:hypothetical protein